MTDSFTSLVREAGRSLSMAELLNRPVTILQGASEDAQSALEDVDVRSVFDLAASSLFAAASRIADATRPDSELGSIGRVPTDMVDAAVHDVPANELATRDIEVLKIIGPQTAAKLKAALAVTSIRDLALWPPYLASLKILNEHYGIHEGVGPDPEMPQELVPRMGQFPTERVQYEVLLFDEFVTGGKPVRASPSHLDVHGPMPTGLLRPLGADGALDIMQLLSHDGGYERPAIGGILTFTQSWYPKGLSLGSLIHSVALAPGESTKIAMIDWSRQSRSSTAEDITETDSLVSDLTRRRAINEITHAVANETQSGRSGAHNLVDATQEGKATGSASFKELEFIAGSPLPISFSSPGVSTSGTSFGKSHGTTDATAWSTSSGNRDITGSLTQKIVDRTHQASHSARDRRASIVREVSQAESEQITTRTITNYNHMHALTIEYYEVVQLYRTLVELSEADRCLFVPMKLVDFTQPRIVDRYRQVIAANGLRGDIRLLSLAANDHFAFRAPLRVGRWNATPLLSLPSPTDEVLSLPSSFSFSDIYFDKSVPFDALVVELTSGEVVTLPLAVEQAAVLASGAVSAHAPSPAAPLKVAQLRVSATCRNKETEDVFAGAQKNTIRFVVNESSFEIDQITSAQYEYRFQASTYDGLNIQLDAGASIGLIWTLPTGRGEEPPSVIGLDDVRFEAKIGDSWMPVARASSLDIPQHGRGATTIPSAPLPPAAAAASTPSTTPAPGATPLSGFLHVRVLNDTTSGRTARRLFGERLREVRNVSARKTASASAANFSGGVTVGVFFESEDRPAHPLGWSISVPADSTSVVLFELEPTATTKELIDHLMSNQVYYSQAIWRSLNPATIGILLSGYTWMVSGQAKPLVELVDPTPVAIVANYLVLRMSGDDNAEHNAWLEKKKIKVGSSREALVPVPSGGVFAESVLGRFNSAEKLDITRFWNWQDSPIPIQAPDIAAIQAGSRRDADNLMPSQLGAPVLSVLNPTNLPDPQGMAAILAAVQNGAMFRDMSGLAATIALAQAGLTGAQQGATAAGAQAGKNAEVAAQLGAKIAEVVEKLVEAYLTKGAGAAAGSGAKGNAGSAGSGSASGNQEPSAAGVGTEALAALAGRSGIEGIAGLVGGISGQGAKINQGKDMDRRGVASQTPDGTGNGSYLGNNGSSGGEYELSGGNGQETQSGNEGAAFSAALGSGSGSGSGGGGFLSNVRSMTEQTVSGASKGGMKEQIILQAADKAIEAVGNAMEKLASDPELDIQGPTNLSYLLKKHNDPDQYQPNDPGEKFYTYRYIFKVDNLGGNAVFDGLKGNVNITWVGNCFLDSDVLFSAPPKVAALWRRTVFRKNVTISHSLIPGRALSSATFKVTILPSYEITSTRSTIRHKLGFEINVNPKIGVPVSFSNDDIELDEKSTDADLLMRRPAVALYRFSMGATGEIELGTYVL